MEKVWNFVKPYGEDALNFVTDLSKSGVKAANKLAKNVTAKTNKTIKKGKKAGHKLLGKAAPICKIVMFVAAGMAVLSGAIWLFGRKK